MVKKIKGLVKLVLRSLGIAVVVSNLAEYSITELKLNDLYWGPNKRAAHDQAELIMRNIAHSDYLFKGGEILAAYKYRELTASDKD